MFDACILGAGPAGLSAALWLHNLGLRPAIFDREPRLGGAQRLNFLSNDWVLGFPGLAGPELADRYVDHVRSLDVNIEMAAMLDGLTKTAKGFSLDFRLPSTTRNIEARTIVITTGTRYRGSEVLAGVEGFKRLPERAVVFGPYAFADLDQCRGKRVLIVGGGDNAFENAKRLIGSAAALTVAVRSRPRAQAQLVRTVLDCQMAGRCRVLQESRLSAIESTPDGLHVTVRRGAESLSIECDRIHVLAGYEPNADAIATLVERAGLPPLRRDAEGYVGIDESMRTSTPGVYAAGDVCNRRFPSVVSAIAQGAAVAKTIESDLAQ
jgi:thioredoxin reductase (NADPH)